MGAINQNPQPFANENSVAYAVLIPITYPIGWQIVLFKADVSSLMQTYVN